MISFPLIVGHRGAALLAPENTLAAFRAGAAAGAAWVELDVRLAADGLVVFHDATLDRTTGRPGAVRAMTVETLSAIAVAGPGAPAAGTANIPSLEEALREIRALGIGVNVELKSDDEEPAALVEQVVRAVDSAWPAGAGPLVYSSFSRETVWALREAAPDRPRGLIASRLPADWRTVAKDLDCVSLHLGWRHLAEEQVAQVREAGYAVAVWTVNERPVAERLRRWGADSIITDDPGLMAGLD